MNNYNINEDYDYNYAYGGVYECNFMDRITLRPRKDITALKDWLLKADIRFLHPKVERDYFKAYEVLNDHLPNKYFLVDQLYKKHGIPLNRCYFKFPKSKTANKKFRDTYAKLGWEYIE